jgi:predicted nucleic acid-binding protein
MKLYLDTCALNRLTDDQAQPRINAEAKAVERVLDLMSSGEVRWISSSVVRTEMQRNPNQAKREVSIALLAFASEFVEPNESAYRRASLLVAEGYGTFDALHLALAEAAGADALLTVDDRLISRANRTRANVLPSVLNPVDWLDRRVKWLPPPQSTK